MDKSFNIPVHALVRYTSPDVIEQLNGHATPVSYESGQFLFYASHRPYGVFLMKSGAIELFCTESGNPMDPPDFSCTVAANIDDGRPLVIGARLLAHEELFPLNGRATTRLEGVFVDRTTAFADPDLHSLVRQLGETSSS